MLASGSAFEDPTIRIWDAATGRLLNRLDGHTGWVCELAFTRDGRRLISAASRSNHPLLGHEHLDRNSGAARPHRRGLCRCDLGAGTTHRQREQGRRPHVVEKGRRARCRWIPPPAGRLSGAMTSCRWTTRACCCCRRASRPSWLISSATPLPCRCPSDRIFHQCPRLFWHQHSLPLERNQPDPRPRAARGGVRSTRSHRVGFRPAPDRIRLQPGAPAPGVDRRDFLDLSLPGEPRGARPSNRTQERCSGGWFPSDSVRMEITSRLGTARRFCAPGTSKLGSIVASINQPYTDACLCGERAGCCVVATHHRIGHEIGFYDLARPDQAPRRFPGRLVATALAVSPDGGLVAASTHSGPVRLFDPAMGEL